MSDHYFGDVLNSFSDGVQLDIRVKMALSFIQNSQALLQIAASAELPDNPPFADKVAILALEIAGALIEQGEKRGWVKEMPEDDGMNTPTKKHVVRSVRRQLFGQAVGQKIQQDEAGRVQPILSVIPPPKH